MPPSKKKSIRGRAEGDGATGLGAVLGELERRGTRAQVRALDRYGIVAAEPFGVAVGVLKSMAKGLGTDHGLALQLWATGRYEARMLATMIDDPGEVTLAQLNAWSAEFDNWAIVDSACFHLFDRSRYAWRMVPQWAKAKLEFRKRAAFALIWSLSVHDKGAPNRSFLEGLKLIEAAAEDERNFVKKAVNMALRATGKRNLVLHAAALRASARLAESEDDSSRWIGRHALREMSSSAVRKRLDSKNR